MKKVVVDKLKENLSVVAVNLSKDNIPTIKENSNHEYVNFGKRNDYLDLLNELFNSAALHSSIVRSKVEMIHGIGFEYNVNDAALNDFILHPNKNDNETLYDIFKKVDNDFMLYGNAALQVVWGIGGKKIVEVYHMDFNTVRSGIANDKGKVEYFYYSPTWKLFKNNIIKIKSFDKTANKDFPTQIIHLKRSTPGFFYYGLPDYQAALTWIQTESEIANFHNNNLKNGMIPGFSITFVNGEPTEDQKSAVYDALQDFFSGSSNAGKCFVSFVDDITKAPIITPLNANNLGEQYLQLNDMAFQAILSGHRVSNPILCGIQTPGKLGSSSEYIDSYQVFYNKVCKPDQTFLLNNFNRILNINGLSNVSIVNEVLEPVTTV